jgi:hypothetical protein
MKVCLSICLSCGLLRRLAAVVLMYCHQGRIVKRFRTAQTVTVATPRPTRKSS